MMSNTPIQDELRKLVDIEIEERLNAFADSNIPSTYRTGSGKDIYNQSSVEAYKDNACAELLERLEQSFNQHTTPEGANLLTRSYVKNTLDFERNNLKSEEKQDE